MADPDFTFIDGFDKYGGKNAEGILTIMADALFQDGEWTSGTCAIEEPIGTTKGNSIGWTNFIDKDLGASYARAVGGMCVQINNTSSAGIQFSVGNADHDLAVHIAGNGQVYLRRGFNSTVLATAAGDMIPLALGSTNFISWDFTPANVSGRAKIWINGYLVIDYTGDTTADGSDGLNYFSLYSATTANRADHFYCDFYLAAGGSETPFLTNPIVDTSDVTTLDSGNFTAGSITLGDVDRFDGQTWNSTSGRTYLRRVKADDSGNLTGVAFVCGTTDVVAKYKACVYSDNASNQPGTLLGSGPDTTGLVSGWNTANLTTPVAIVAGTWYWIGFRIDTSNRLLYASESSSSGLGYYYSSTYSTAFLATASGLTGYWSPYCAGIMTGMTNRAATINSPKPDTSLRLNYNFSNTPGQEDIFNHNALPGVPTAVHHVALKAMALRSDAGPRTADLRLKSGAVTDSGSKTGITPNPVEPKWMGTHYRKDPNGNIAWTVANHNNIKIGYKLVS